MVDLAAADVKMELHWQIKKCVKKIQEKDPEMWRRFETRRKYLQDVLHIHLHDDVLPLSNVVAFARHYLLDKESALVNGNK